MAASLKTLITPKTAFFLFWILFFVVSHLWNFRTAPWNGNALFDESGWDLWYLKSYVIGHPYQPAWYHIVISRETLFHYYVWGFLKLFGFNILSYEAALFCLWLTTYVFTLLLVDLFFDSYVVTSVTALILNFLPFAFIYTFAGYRYPMATALAVVSLYFLHLGFRIGFSFLPFAGRDCGRALFGELDIREAISVSSCDCRTAVRCILLEDVKAKGYVGLARLGHLWLCGGCHADSALYLLQSRSLHFIRIRLCSRFLACNAIRAVSDWYQAVQQAAFGLLFHCAGSSLFYPRYFTNPTSILLVVGTWRRTRALAKAL